jgi:uncharacterized LabA/DUF88 family protein
MLTATRSVQIEPNSQIRKIVHAPTEYLHRNASVDTKHKQVNSVKPRRISDNRGRVATFVDGSNLFYAASAMRIQIEHRKLLRYITGNSYLSDAFFYTGFNPLNYKEHTFLSYIRREGYQVIEKTLIQRSDGSKKANLDVEIALDMVIKAFEKTYDTAVLVSGDGDFTYAVNAVRSKNIRVEVIGLYSMTSSTLINSADRYIDLANIKDQIGKPYPPSTLPRPSSGFPHPKRLQMG